MTRHTEPLMEFNAGRSTEAAHNWVNSTPTDLERMCIDEAIREERDARMMMSAIGVGDWIAKIALVALWVGFIWSLYHALRSGAVERLVR